MKCVIFVLARDRELFIQLEHDTFTQPRLNSDVQIRVHPFRQLMYRIIPCNEYVKSFTDMYLLNFHYLYHLMCKAFPLHGLSNIRNYELYVAWSCK